MTTCLIIDDEKLARELLREFLESFPEIEIIGECSKGTEAVEQIDKLKPDLIFLDVQMPGMNGFDVLDEIEHEPYVIFLRLTISMPLKLLNAMRLIIY